MKTTSISPSLETYTSRIVALSLLVLLLALAGCTTATKTAADTNPAGAYTLVSVNGQAVPCNLTHEGVAMIVKSGSFIINADDTCRSISVFAVPPHPDIHREVNATYTQTGAELTIRWQRAGITTGQVNGNEFSMDNEGMVFLYRK